MSIFLNFARCRKTGKKDIYTCYLLAKIIEKILKILRERKNGITKPKSKPNNNTYTRKNNTYTREQ